MFYVLKSEIKEKGWKKEILETFGLLVVIYLLWKLLAFFMNTESPISAIATCSMAQNLMAGDMVLVKKDNINTQYVEMTEQDIDKINNQIELIDLESGSSTSLKYSVLTECITFCNACENCNLLCKRNESACVEFIKKPERFIEKRGNLEFLFRKCEYLDTERNISYPTICSYAVKIKDKNSKDIIFDVSNFNLIKNNSIIVYTPKISDAFSDVPGDITHRVILGIKTNSSTYYLAKGDHNDRFDLQIDNPLKNKRNSLISENQINGNIFYSMPYIGYLKLFLSLRFDYQHDCNLKLNYI
ncbi:MAG: hypothetical protein QW076_06260 [Candidatus Anstonellales archaeon]